VAREQQLVGRRELVDEPGGERVLAKPDLSASEEGMYCMIILIIPRVVPGVGVSTATRRPRRRPPIPKRAPSVADGTRTWPVATASMSSDGRLAPTKPLKSVRMSATSACDASRSSFVGFLVGVSLRLYLPAVTVRNSMPSRLSRS